MLEEVRDLVENGFAVHILRPRSKRPIGTEWASARVFTYAELKRRYNAHSDRFDEDCNLGVRLGKPSKVDGKYLHVIDLDVRKKECAEEAEARLKKLFKGVKIARLPCVRSGSETGASRHYYFVTDEPFKSRKLATSSEQFEDEEGKRHFTWEIELFGTGKQVALPPSVHPDSGKRYRWIIEPAFEIGIPEIDSGLIGDLVYGTDERKLVERDEESRKPLGLSFGEVEELLSWVPTWADKHDKWRDVGFMVKHELGERGWGLFDAWSSKGRGYDKKNNREQWKGFNSDRDEIKTIRTLVAEVNELKSKAALKADLEDLPPITEDESGDQKTKRQELPKLVREMPGVLKEFVDYFNDTCMVRQPELATLAAIGLGSVVGGRNICTPVPNYTSLYLMGVGETGAGKEFVRTSIKRVLKACGLSDFASSDNFTSEGGLLSQLMASPKSIALSDEFGKRLADERKGGDVNKANVATAVMSIYGVQGDEWRPTGYSTMGKTKEEAAEIRSRKVERAALTMVALTTPSTLYRAIDGLDIENGFLNRFIVVQVKGKLQRQRIMPVRRPVPERLVEWVKRTVLLCAHEDDEMLLAADQAAEVEPLLVPFSKKCLAALEDVETARIARMNELGPLGLQELYSRARENTQRLALILALSEEYDTVQAKHVELAWDYIRFYVEQSIESVKMSMGRSQLHKIAEKLAEMVIESKDKGLTRREIGRNFSAFTSLSTRESAEVEGLLKRDYGIIESTFKTGGRSRQALILAKYIKSKE